MRHLPESIFKLFNDSPERSLINYDFFKVEEIKKQIESVGFSIARGIIPLAAIENIRLFWLERFSKMKPRERVTWSPSMGAPNTIGYSNDSFQNLFRACDFLWNEPFHVETRNICLRIHALRNLILDEDPQLGLRFTDRRYGIFVTASYYPPNGGHMASHVDGVSEKNSLIHSLIPITFYGRDYKQGGMTVTSKMGKKIHIDALVQPGDAIFYDGSLPHSVESIIPYEGKTLGRLQVFPIPTKFTNLEDNPVAISRIPLKSFLSAKKIIFKEKLRLAFGRPQSIR